MRNVWGFTASRELSDPACLAITERLRELAVELDFQDLTVERDLEFVTGGCRGGDAYVGEFLVGYWGDRVRHTVVLPANRSQVSDWWTWLPPHLRELVTVIEMPPGTDYRDRNQFMVDRSSDFEGFPAYSEADGHSRRSGTWQTIRMATRAGKLRKVTVTGGVRSGTGKGR